MKARKFKRLRKKINNINFLYKKQKRLAYIERDLKYFYTFECDSFFEGNGLAKLNLKKYKISRKKLYKKQEQIERLLNRLESK